MRGNIHNQIIDSYEYKQTRNADEIVEISSSIIRVLTFPAGFISNQIIIDNCIIDTLIISNTRFKAGFSLRNSIIKKEVSNEAGGYNNAPFEMENNIFVEYVDFFDSIFEDTVIIRDNVFSKGTNLLLKQNAETDPSFEKGLIVRNNIGKLDADYPDLIDW